MYKHPIYGDTMSRSVWRYTGFIQFLSFSAENLYSMHVWDVDKQMVHPSKRMPMKVTVQKSLAQGVALAKLHSYCIDAQDSCTDAGITAIDKWTSELNGAAPLVPVQVDDAMHQVVPKQRRGGAPFQRCGRCSRSSQSTATVQPH